MTPRSLPPPVWVDKPQTFNQMVADLSAQSRIAVDTESNSLHAYREQVCLMQFSTPKKEYVGLDNLLAEKCQVRMDKHHQKADWAERPLRPAQIDYARLDTHYLFDLRDLLEAELQEKERLELAREDFVRACEGEGTRGELNGSSWKRFAARKDVSARELTILSELCVSRDQIAEKMNRPPFKVIGDTMLLEIARSQPEKA